MIVGKPLQCMCTNRGATVTLCHSRTQHLSQHTRAAHIIVSATGIPSILTNDMVQDNTAVIDVGITRTSNGIVGDTDFTALEPRTQITPVPGGVGPMTRAMLLENMYLA